MSSVNAFLFILKFSYAFLFIARRVSSELVA